MELLYKYYGCNSLVAEIRRVVSDLGVYEYSVSFRDDKGPLPIADMRFMTLHDAQTYLIDRWHLTAEVA